MHLIRGNVRYLEIARIINNCGCALIGVHDFGIVLDSVSMTKFCFFPSVFRDHGISGGLHTQTSSTQAHTHTHRILTDKQHSELLNPEFHLVGGEGGGGKTPICQKEKDKKR